MKEIIKTKENSAGIMHTIQQKNTTIYSIFTHAQNYRGGKIYFNDKYFVILSWTCELTSFDGEQDTTQYITPEHGTICIPSGMPNIFYFPEDTEMLEWFPLGTKTEDFERYREMKKKS